MRQGHACASPWVPKPAIRFRHQGYLSPPSPVRPLILSSPSRPTYPNDSLFCYGADSASGAQRRNPALMADLRFRGEAEASPPDCHLGPAKARENGATHDPIFVLLGQERQLLGEMGNALLVGGLGEAIGDIGPPTATLRTVCIEQPADVGGEITKRISFG